jgi:hypothetical protein
VILFPEPIDSGAPCPSHGSLVLFRAFSKPHGAQRASGKVTAPGPGGGTVVVHPRNEEGTLQGQVPFAICR